MKGGAGKGPWERSIEGGAGKGAWERSLEDSAEFKIKLAERVIGICACHDYVRRLCREYLTEAPADLTVAVSKGDIDFEREKSAREDALAGITPRRFSDGYLEALAVYRRIAEKMLDHDTLLFHGSAIAVDGTGYLFAARSGTGKSTHARLWRQQFGERAVMVNDDKPLLRVTEDGVTVYGTPWDGKHHLSSPIAVPLKAVCILRRDVSDHIEPIGKREAWPMLLQQAYRPADPAALSRVLTLLDRLAGQVSLYSLGCTMEQSAALVSYEGMNPEKRL